MLDILKEGGDNTYNIPHINKKKMDREGKLKTEVLVSEDMMELINDYKICTNQVRITSYYPPITCLRGKYLIEI